MLSVAFEATGIRPRLASRFDGVFVDHTAGADALLELMSSDEMRSWRRLHRLLGLVPAAHRHQVEQVCLWGCTPWNVEALVRLGGPGRSPAPAPSMTRTTAHRSAASKPSAADRGRSQSWAMGGANRAGQLRVKPRNCGGEFQCQMLMQFCLVVRLGLSQTCRPCPAGHKSTAPRSAESASSVCGPASGMVDLDKLEAWDGTGYEPWVSADAPRG